MCSSVSSRRSHAHSIKPFRCAVALQAGVTFAFQSIARSWSVLHAALTLRILRVPPSSAVLSEAVPRLLRNHVAIERIGLVHRHLHWFLSFRFMRRFCGPFMFAPRFQAYGVRRKQHDTIVSQRTRQFETKSNEQSRDRARMRLHGGILFRYFLAFWSSNSEASGRGRNVMRRLRHDKTPAQPWARSLAFICMRTQTMPSQ